MRLRVPLPRKHICASIYLSIYLYIIYIYRYTYTHTEDRVGPTAKSVPEYLDWLDVLRSRVPNLCLLSLGDDEECGRVAETGGGGGPGSPGERWNMRWPGTCSGGAWACTAGSIASFA